MGQTGVGIFLFKLSFQMILGWFLKLAKDYILGLVSLGALFHEFKVSHVPCIPGEHSLHFISQGFPVFPLKNLLFFFF